LVAATPQVSVAEALALAAGPARYVRISGRIDAEDEFEDDAHRPLVWRRTRLQVRRADRSVDVEDGRRRGPPIAGSPPKAPAGASRSSAVTAWTGPPSTTPRSTSGSSSCRASRSAP